ncbi:hypothetical protein ACQZV8_16610 [Magnetococcales bacterium HHB-1]
MDYTFKQVTNGYFTVEFSMDLLQKGWADNCYRYDYVLGEDNELTLSLLEYENSRYLEHFQDLLKQPIQITLEILKPSARNRFGKFLKYHTLTFNGCQAKRYTNNGHVDRVSHSTVKILFNFDDFEVEYH